MTPAARRDILFDYYPFILYSLYYILFNILYSLFYIPIILHIPLYYIPYIIFLYIIFYGYYIISYSSLSVSIICGIDLVGDRFPMLCNWCKTLLCRIKLEWDESFLEHTSHS